MEPSEVSGLHYLNSSPYPPHFTMAQDCQTPPSFHFSKISISNPLYNTIQVPAQVQEVNMQQWPTCFSNNSTSDEGDEQQVTLINERKQRRMISNRESARRSRMRKQRHLDELWSQVMWLRNENHQLIDKMNHVSEVHDKALQENAQLKEEVSELRQMLTDMQLNNTYSTLRDLEDVSCNTAHLRAESSNHSITSSMDLLG